MRPFSEDPFFYGKLGELACHTVHFRCPADVNPFEVAVPAAVGSLSY